MKTAFILLLGFAGLLPATCSKSKTEKQSKNGTPVKVDTARKHLDVALYGPVIVAKKTQKCA